ncbi:hypothetical protein ALT785_830029 [Alteromonas infernus]
MVLFTVPVDACEMKMDEHSSLTKVSHKFADAHEEKRSSSPSSKHQSAHTDGHPSRIRVNQVAAMMDVCV